MWYTIRAIKDNVIYEEKRYLYYTLREAKAKYREENGLKYKRGVTLIINGKVE